MNAAATAVAPLGSYLTSKLVVHEPIVMNVLAVFPIVGGECGRSLATTWDRPAPDLLVRELPMGAVVNRLLVENREDHEVLLYEGQQLAGARQHRVLDHSVVVPARGALVVGVTCVEEGRWDASRTHERFRTDGAVVHASLRRTLVTSVGRVDSHARQHLAWSHVRERVARHHTPTHTSSLLDVYDAAADAAASIAGRVTAIPRQTGALVALAGRFVSLDWIACPRAFASALRALAAGYAMDALDAATQPCAAPAIEDAQRLLDGILAAPVAAVSSAGSGLRLRVAADRFEGSGLVDRGALVQMAVHVA